jgi:hypothetical protein
MKKLTILLILLWIASEAISEAMFDNNLKMWSKVVQAGMIIFQFVIYYILTKDYYLPLIYLGLRILNFDFIYNAVAGLPINYCGSTEVSKWLCLLQHTSIVWFGVLFATVILIVKYLERDKHYWDNENKKFIGIEEYVRVESTFEKIFKYSVITMIGFGVIHFLIVDLLFQKQPYYFELKRIIFIVTLGLSIVVFGCLLIVLIRALIQNIRK